MAKKDEEQEKTVAVTVKNVSTAKHFKMARPALPPPKHYTAGAAGYVAADVTDLEKAKERAGKEDEPLFDLAPGEATTVAIPEGQMHRLTPTLEDAQMRGFIQWSAPGYLSGRPTFGVPGGTVVARHHQHAGQVALAGEGLEADSTARAK